MWKLESKKIKQTLHLNASLMASESGINLFLVFHYRFNITHSNLGDEIMHKGHVTETVNNNGIFKSKMLQLTNENCVSLHEKPEFTQLCVLLRKNFASLNKKAIIIFLLINIYFSFLTFIECCPNQKTHLEYNFIHNRTILSYDSQLYQKYPNCVNVFPC